MGRRRNARSFMEPALRCELGVGYGEGGEPARPEGGGAKKRWLWPADDEGCRACGLWIRDLRFSEPFQGKQESRLTTEVGQHGSPSVTAGPLWARRLHCRLRPADA